MNVTALQEGCQNPWFLLNRQDIGPFDARATSLGTPRIQPSTRAKARSVGIRSGFKNPERVLDDVSSQVHRETFEIGECTIGQSSFVRGTQDDAGGLTCLECYLPARRT
jgi:hypothetical protein